MYSVPTGCVPPFPLFCPPLFPCPPLLPSWDPAFADGDCQAIIVAGAGDFFFSSNRQKKKKKVSPRLRWRVGNGNSRWKITWCCCPVLFDDPKRSVAGGYLLPSLTHAVAVERASVKGCGWLGGKRKGVLFNQRRGTEVQEGRIEENEEKGKKEIRVWEIKQGAASKGNLTKEQAGRFVLTSESSKSLVSSSMSCIRAKYPEVS